MTVDPPSATAVAPRIEEAVAEGENNGGSVTRLHCGRSRDVSETVLFPVTPRYKVQGAPGSTAELAVEFTGGVRSYFEADVANVYDEGVAAKRSEALKTKYRSDIEVRWDELKKK